MSKIELKHWLNSINFNKENLIKENPDILKQYPPYIVNRCLSGFIDTIMVANEVNINHHLSKKLQYEFLLNIVRPKRRFSPWLKKEKIDDLDAEYNSCTFYPGHFFHKPEWNPRSYKKDLLRYSQVISYKFMRPGPFQGEWWQNFGT